MSSKTRLLSIALLIPIWFVPETAVAQVLIGYVASIEGDIAGAYLLRGDTPPRRLRLGENVLAGDTITAKLETKVRIDTRTGSADPCIPPPATAPCRLHFPASSDGLPGAEIAGRISVMLTWFAAQSQNLVVSRAGNPPSMAIPTDRAQKLVAGHRSLRIAWNDGQPPYSVTLEAAGRALSSIQTQAREVRLPPIDLPLGPGKILVTDSNLQRFSLPLAIVRVGPDFGDLKNSAINSEHYTLLELGATASMENGAWLFEAFQGVDRLGTTTAAITFERALRSGGRP